MFLKNLLSKIKAKNRGRKSLDVASKKLNYPLWYIEMIDAKKQKHEFKVYAENQKYALRYAVIMMQKRQIPEPYKVYSISCL